MERAAGKAARLLQIESLLLAHPDGLSQAEIARRIGVNRSTVYRYLPDLTARFAIYDTGDGRLAIDRDHYLMNVRLTLHESMALHLAARLMATRTDKQNPHAAAALRKLGLALEKLAPRVSEHLKASARVMEDRAQRHDPVYLDVLETLTRAWSDGRVAHLWHRMADGRVFEYDFAPYFIEPYAVGQTTHVIGWRDPPRALRTLKLERIQRIEFTGTTYAIPADFDPAELLADAWGIWYTEAQPVQVTLEFHPRVASRVRETRWHRSEQVEQQPHGSLIWRAQVAEPQEMLPWIRGWGADVEVLEPEELREGLTNETRRLAALYDIKPIPAYQLLWAKTSKDKRQTHPLICHMIDVGQVTLALWETALTDSIRGQFAAALGLTKQATARLISFWASLHDLGKACPGFQRKHSPAQRILANAGLPFLPQYAKESFAHGTASTSTLHPLLETEFDLSRRDSLKIARAVGGHHGAWPLAMQLQNLKPTHIGGEEWASVRLDLTRALVTLFSPPDVEHLGANQLEENALLTLLSGLTSVADWIGSMQTYFPYIDGPPGLSGYARRSAKQAHQALQALGWATWRPPKDGKSFWDLFHLEPRSMQRAVVGLAATFDQPALVIIEAPTGVGKTEAALCLFDHWAHTSHQRGLYVAMPTMATSNQMFSRLRTFLSQRYSNLSIEPLLIHSQARWSKDMHTLGLATAGEREDDTASAMAWFLPRKRSLLAPFGVGTVDQALMSILQTRHFFVRLFALSHKTVIFDEVHAYDTYMSTLFQRLLHWLRAVGASVVLLSATLPAQTRRELLEAYASAPPRLPDISYPALTWASSAGCGALPLKACDDHRVALYWIEPKPEMIAQRLAHELRDGGCAAVICNTVKRAQNVYRAVKSAGIVPQEDVILFHARFPFAWREDIERRILSSFGKNGKRPQKAIVVATQVIEQSLDLDFDVMFTDLAPVDLILQRVGRLHRHQRDHRPASLSSARLFIAAPVIKDGLPDFERDAYVYEPYVLLRSYLTLRHRDQLILPTETETVVEAVYGEEDLIAEHVTPDLIRALTDARNHMHRRQEEHVYEARQRIVPGPQADDLLRQSNLALAEDSPEIHQTLQALTRLIPPSVSLVCLHSAADMLTLGPDGKGPSVDLSEKPQPDLTEQLARHTLTVTHYGVVRFFFQQQIPAGWRDHALLRNYRAAVFSNGLCPLPGTAFTLQLDRKVGLEINKLESA